MIKAIVLAAGKSSRFGKPITKVCHFLQNKRILHRVINNLVETKIDDITVIIGHQGKIVKRILKKWNVHYAIQQKQLGTGDAIKAVRGIEGDILVVFGDKPLFRPQTLKEFIQTHLAAQTVVSVATVIHPNPEAYSEGKGSVIRVNGRIIAFEYQKNLNECDAALYMFKSSWLWKNIDKLQPKKFGPYKDEYCLPDLINLAYQQDKKIGEYRIRDYLETIGVNTQKQFQEAAEALNILGEA